MMIMIIILILTVPVQLIYGLIYVTVGVKKADASAARVLTYFINPVGRDVGCDDGCDDG